MLVRVYKIITYEGYDFEVYEKVNERKKNTLTYQLSKCSTKHFLRLNGRHPHAKGEVHAFYIQKRWINAIIDCGIQEVEIDKVLPLKFTKFQY